jgi:calcyclin binding protein
MSHAPLELRAALAELEVLRAQSRHPRVQLALDKELAIVRAELTYHEQLLASQPAGPAPMEMDPSPVEIPCPIASAPFASSSPTLVQCTGAPLAKVPTEITSYGWDQSKQFVKVYLTVKDCGPGFTMEHCKLAVEATRFSLFVSCPSGKLYRLSVGPLGGNVISEGSSVKAKPDGSVVVSLRKAESTTWTDVKFKEDKIKTPSLGKDEDPQAGLMSLMKNLYDEGDDEMKKTISKAFYESQAKKDGAMPF